VRLKMVSFKSVGNFHCYWRPFVNCLYRLLPQASSVDFWVWCSPICELCGNYLWTMRELFVNYAGTICELCPKYFWVWCSPISTELACGSNLYSKKKVLLFLLLNLLQNVKGYGTFCENYLTFGILAVVRKVVSFLNHHSVQ